MEVYNENNEIIYDHAVVLDKWRKEFEGLYNPQGGNVNENFLKYIKDENLMFENVMLDPLFDSSNVLNSDFTFEEVEQATFKSKNKKAVGIDKLPNEILKNHHIIVVMKELFQLCFDTSKIPSEWLKAIILPIPKNSENDPRIPLNYRGLSLLSCVSKIFTSLLNNRITKFLNVNEILVDEQNGFRKSRSCTDHVFALHAITQLRQNENKSTFVTFIDFSKAFDCVNRDMLFNKLLTYGIDGKMYFIIKSLYRNTDACVKVNSLFTEWFRTLFGVRQGDSLSPTLFSIFINDLAQGLKELGVGVHIDNSTIPVLLYADDVAIISENEHDMQLMLNYIEDWCKTWGMKINMAKSKMMHIRKKGTACSPFKFKLGPNYVEYTQKYKYLGVILDEFLDFSGHTDAMTSSGLRALGTLISKYKKMNGMGYETYTKCYNTCVCPVIDYGSEVWGYIKCPKIDTVQNKALRVYLGVHRYAANGAINGDMAWVPSESRRKINMIRYWNRMVQMDNNRLTKKVFLYEVLKKGKWAKYLEKIFDELGETNAFVDQSVLVVNDCGNVIAEHHERNWAKLVQQKPKLRLHASVKPSYQVEQYVLFNLEKHQRSVLAQLRCGILPLEVELGRFKNVKLEERLCKLCQLNKVEDELHFLFHCPAYEHERDTFYNSLHIVNFMDISDKTKICILFEKYIRNFAKFVCTLLDTRQTKLYVS